MTEIYLLVNQGSLSSFELVYVVFTICTHSALAVFYFRKDFMSHLMHAVVGWCAWANLSNNLFFRSFIFGPHSQKRMNSLSVLFRERIEEDIGLFFYGELAVFSFGKENSCLEK